MGYYKRTVHGRWSGKSTVECYRHDRDKKYNKRKTDFIKANDKLKMLGLIFTAGFRAMRGVGVEYKELRIFLYENPELHSYMDEKNLREYIEKLENDGK